MNKVAQEQVVFPGINGVPFRGTEVPLLKKEQLEKKLVKVHDVYVKVFTLSKEKDLEEYQDVLNKVTKGEMIISKEQINWSSELNTYVVFLRYGQPFMEMKQSHDRKNYFAPDPSINPHTGLPKAKTI